MKSTPHDPGWLWITDPWDTLDHPCDTTLRLVEEACRIGIVSYWADVRTTTWAERATVLEIFRIEVSSPARRASSFTRQRVGWRRPSDFTTVHYRPDPPADLAYLQPLELIHMDLQQRAARDGPWTELINPAAVLFGRCEKVLSDAPELMPPTLVTSQEAALVAFGREHGRTIVKPMHACQSRGVALLDWHDQRAHERSRVALAEATGGFTRPVVLQRYLPAVLEGETRLWLIDGELLACACKHPAGGTYKIDMDEGATLCPHRLSGREAAILPRLSAVLRCQQIRLAAVDLIDGLVTDFNFTSPGLLPLMESVLDRNLARPLLNALQRPFAGPRDLLEP